MNVSHVMSRTIMTVRASAGISQLWRMIFRHHINAVPVVDASKSLLGLITREDILKRLYPNYQDMLAGLPKATDFEDMEKTVKDSTRLKAKDIMNTHVIYTRVGTPIMRALSRMIVRNVDQLPVIDEEDRVVGMVTKGDIFNALFRVNFSIPGKALKLLKKHKKGKK